MKISPTNSFVFKVYTNGDPVYRDALGESVFEFGGKDVNRSNAPVLGESAIDKLATSLADPNREVAIFTNPGATLQKAGCSTNPQDVLLFVRKSYALAMQRAFELGNQFDKEAVITVSGRLNKPVSNSKFHTHTDIGDVDEPCHFLGLSYHETQELESNGEGLLINVGRFQGLRDTTSNSLSLRDGEISFTNKNSFASPELDLRSQPIAMFLEGPEHFWHAGKDSGAAPDASHPLRPIVALSGIPVSAQELEVLNRRYGGDFESSDIEKLLGMDSKSREDHIDHVANVKTFLAMNRYGSFCTK